MLVALVLQVAGYMVLVVALDATTTVPHITTLDGSPIRPGQLTPDYISYPAQSPLFAWLPKLVCLPQVLAVGLAVARWRRSRAIAIGLLGGIILRAPLWANVAGIYTFYITADFPLGLPHK
jgi:hypothetical protein